MWAVTVAVAVLALAALFLRGGDLKMGIGLLLGSAAFLVLVRIVANALRE